MVLARAGRALLQMAASGTRNSAIVSDVTHRPVLPALSESCLLRLAFFYLFYGAQGVADGGIRRWRVVTARPARGTVSRRQSGARA